MKVGDRVQHIERGWLGTIAHPASGSREEHTFGEHRHLIDWENGKQSWCHTSWLNLVEDRQRQMDIPPAPAGGKA